MISTHTSLAGRDDHRIHQYFQFVISTHTSLAGRDIALQRLASWIGISTHTSLAGRDLNSSIQGLGDVLFLLTRPSRDVTVNGSDYCTRFHISTHTSLAGRDRIRLAVNPRSANFYSHVPRGT